MCYYTYIAVYHVSSIDRRHNNNNLVRTGMKNSSKTWLLGGILLLPGALIALTMQFLSTDLFSSDRHQSIRVLSALPPTSAGDSELMDVGGEIWNGAVKPVTYTERIQTKEMTTSMEAATITSGGGGGYCSTSSMPCSSVSLDTAQNMEVEPHTPPEASMRTRDPAVSEMQEEPATLPGMATEASADPIMPSAAAQRRKT